MRPRTTGRPTASLILACFRKDGCSSASLQYSDGPGDDVAGDAIQLFFPPLPVLPTDFIHVRLTGGFETDFEWCAERADVFVANYLAFAVGNGSAVSGGWQVWYRHGSGEAWSGPLVDDFVNSYGVECGEPYSWCAEAGLGGWALALLPLEESDCEVADYNTGCGIDIDTSVVVITVGDARISACGF